MGGGKSQTARHQRNRDTTRLPHKQRRARTGDRYEKHEAFELWSSKIGSALSASLFFIRASKGKNKRSPNRDCPTFYHLRRGGNLFRYHHLCDKYNITKTEKKQIFFSKTYFFTQVAPNGFWTG